MENAATILLFVFVFGIPYITRIFFAVQNNGDKAVLQRLPYFDALKGVAILAVVLIHVRYMYGMYVNVNDYTFLHITNNILRFAIPIFLICSGVLLEPRIAEKQWTLFYVKKMVRIFIPYILVVLGVVLYYGRSDQFWYLLMTGEASTPYYFMLVLLQCYVLYPLMVLARNYKQELLIISFFISFLSFFLPQTWHIYGMPTVFQYLFFFVYGYAQRDRFIDYEKNMREFFVWPIIAIMYVMVVIIKPEMFFNTRLFYGVAAFNILFYIKKHIERANILYKPLIYIGKNSLWIYLLHFFILETIFIHAKTLTGNYYLDFFLFFFIALAVTVCISVACGFLYNRIIRLFNIQKQPG